MNTCPVETVTSKFRQDLFFLTSAIPIRPLKEECAILNSAGAHAERKLHIIGLDLKAVILALHYWDIVLRATKLWSLPHQHTGPDPSPHPVTSSSGSVPMATNSRHIHKDQTHSGMSDYASGSQPNQPITTKSGISTPR